MRWGWPAAIALLLAFATTSARADGSVRIAMLPVAGSSSHDAALAGAAERALLDAGYAVVAAAAHLDDLVLMMGCEGPTDECLDQVADTLEADGLFSIRTETADGATTAHAIFRSGGETLRTAVKLTGDAGAVGPFEKAMDELLGVERESPAAAPALTSDPDPEPTSADLSASTSEVDPAAIRLTTWVTLGVGAVTLGVGGAFLAAARGKQSDVDDAPTDTQEDLERLARLEDDGETLTTRSNILLGVGAAITAAGATLLVLDLMRDSDGPEEISLAPTREGAQVSASWRF